MTDIIPYDDLSLSTPMEELEQRIINETDQDKLQQTIDLFNLNLKKKDLIRASKLNDIQDRISDQISKRIDIHGDEFSNKDLIEYFKTVNDVIKKSTSKGDDLDVGTVQINQNQLNIDMSKCELDQEGRKRVTDVVSSILNKLKDDQQNNPIVVDNYREESD